MCFFSSLAASDVLHKKSMLIKLLSLQDVPVNEAREAKLP